MALHLRREAIDLAGRRVLHFSPERSFYRQWKGNPHYVAGDIKKSKVANTVVDITAIAFPDDHFDVLICHHVLEHVVEDHKGMRESVRVLKPGGFACFSVPMDISREMTWERPPDMSIARFERVVGWDHKRLYGMDFAEKLQAAGFRDVRPIAFTEEEAERYRLSSQGLDLVYVCTK
jgi:SAM-dependent methyltransferase